MQPPGAADELFDDDEFSDTEQLFVEDDGDRPKAPTTKRGRPPGARNKQTKEAVVSKERLRRLYDRFYPFMDSDNRTYIEGIINGTSKVDVEYEMELLVRQMGILLSEATIWYFDNKRIDKNLADMFSALGRSLKDLNDVRTKREDREALKAAQDNDGYIRVTDGGSALDRLNQSIVRDSSK